MEAKMPHTLRETSSFRRMYSQCVATSTGDSHRQRSTAAFLHTGGWSLAAAGGVSREAGSRRCRSGGERDRARSVCAGNGGRVFPILRTSRSAAFISNASLRWWGRFARPTTPPAPAWGRATRSLCMRDESDSARTDATPTDTSPSPPELAAAEHNGAPERRQRHLRRLAQPPDDFGRVPERIRITILCFLAFMVNSIDRINLSVAILPMRSVFHWSSTTVGLIQSAFFWGYMLTQLPGGYLADRFGGRSVLAAGVIAWSAMTFLTPAASSLGLPSLLLARALLGVGEGVAMPAMNNLISQWVPDRERSRSLSLIYSGMYMGSVIGLLACPRMIAANGWQSVFYIFGMTGLIWYVCWEIFTNASRPQDSVTIDNTELRYLEQEMQRRAPSSADGGGDGTATDVGATRKQHVPWRRLLSERATWAIMIGHFCCTWGYFLLLAWLPTYFNQALGFDLHQSALLCVMPWLTMFLGANASGWIADAMLASGRFSTTVVRKIMQLIGFLGPAAFLALVAGTHDARLAVVYMATALGLASFSQSGIYSNHADIGPQYAGSLLALSNTVATIPGITGVALTGWLLDVTGGSWSVVFSTAIFFYLLGSVVYTAFGTGKRIF